MKFNNRNLTVLMTYRMSLRIWAEAGMFSREVKVINTLAKYYHRIFLLTYGGESELNYSKHLANNTEILYRPKNMPYIIYSLLAPLIYREHLSSTHICRTIQLWGSWTALLLKLFYGAKLIARQGYQQSKFASKSRNPKRVLATIALELVTYKLADAIIVTTPSDRSYIVSRYKIKPRKILVVPNFVDTSLFKRYNEVERKDDLICFVGRVHPQKNPLALIAAVKDLEKAKLLIIGDGFLRNEISHKLKDEEISNVILLDPRPHEELPLILNKCALFILPSLYEGHPKTLIEAMACELPVIGSNVDGIKNIIVHGVTGYLCGTDSESIGNAILHLLSDSELRNRLGRNARLYVEGRYTFNKVFMMELAAHLMLNPTSQHDDKSCTGVVNSNPIAST